MVTIETVGEIGTVWSLAAWLADMKKYRDISRETIGHKKVRMAGTIEYKQMWKNCYKNALQINLCNLR